MRDIIKAINYQTRRDNFTIYACLGAAAVVCMFFIENPKGLLQMTGSGYVSSDMFRQSVSEILVIAMFMCARIVGWDQNDKTINYEQLSGHKRGEIFFGRVIPALMWSAVVCVIAVLLPVVFLTVKNGWGVQVEFSPMAVRFALWVLIFLRVCCESILITFLLRNCYLAIICGYFMLITPFIVGMFLEEFSNANGLTWQFSLENAAKLFEMNGRLQLIDGSEKLIYDSSLPLDLVLGTILMSAGCCALCMLLGYIQLKKRDMR